MIDDLLVYHRSRDVYQIVVNASNADKDWAWLNAVNNGEVLIDRARPDLRVLRPADSAQSEGPGQRRRICASTWRCRGRPRWRSCRA